MVSALESANFYNDTDTGQHIHRVARYSGLLAEKVGLGKDLTDKIRLYAPLHDVGKVGIPDTLLKKPGKYTPEEFELMKSHVSIGAEMLGKEGFDPVARNIALYHHEKWSGKGYLKGLSGERIPIEARIVALADVYDALTTARSYKAPFSQEKTDRILEEESDRILTLPWLTSILKIRINLLPYGIGIRTFKQTLNGADRGWDVYGYTGEYEHLFLTARFPS